MPQIMPGSSATRCSQSRLKKVRSIQGGIVTKVLTRMLFLMAAALTGQQAFAQIAGPTNEFTVHDGAWHLYKRLCSGCHGFTGQGIFPVGPPLRGNAFVTNARPADIAA